MRRSRQFAWLILPLCGLLVWAVYFLAAYSFVAIACAQGVAAAEIFGARAIVVVPLILAGGGCALILAAWLTLERGRSATTEDAERQFLIGAGRIVSLLSLLAIGLSAIPALLLTC